MPVDVKVCGLSTVETVEAAVDGGACWVGFVFFPGSPRYVEPARVPGLCRRGTGRTRRVGLVVDFSDDEIDGVVAKSGVDMLQLHGRETPERTREIRRRWALPVIKAVAIGDEEDLAGARAYEGVADALLFDARAPVTATRPGGNAVSFDWRLLRGTSWRIPWILAGGLNEYNLSEAVHESGATCVDVSSGVEERPGIKSAPRIAGFLKAAALASSKDARCRDGDEGAGPGLAAR